MYVHATQCFRLKGLGREARVFAIFERKSRRRNGKMALEIWELGERGRKVYAACSGAVVQLAAVMGWELLEYYAEKRE